MQVKYILTIIGISLFLACFLLFIVFTSRRRKREALLWEELEKLYSDKSRQAVDYDYIISEEDLEFLNRQEMRDGQLTIEDFIGGNRSAVYESIFTAVDGDGLEEITGNYTPDNSQ